MLTRKTANEVDRVFGTQPHGCVRNVPSMGCLDRDPAQPPAQVRLPKSDKEVKRSKASRPKTKIKQR
jgi:hypothetical protein